MKKVISLVLTVLMLVSFGTAFAATPVAANELAYRASLKSCTSPLPKSPKAMAAPTVSAPCWLLGLKRILISP